MTPPIIHLVDLIGSAEVNAPGPGHVELQYIDVGGDERHALFQHPDSSVRLALPPDFPGGVLSSACGIATAAWTRIRDPVEFRLGVDRGDGGPEWLHRTRLDPRRKPQDRRWTPFEVVVAPGAAIVLETSARRTAGAWAGWADPVLRWESAQVRPARRVRRAHAHVLLVTADACRADLTTAPVPAAEVLARDGIRCTDARTVSTVPTSSCASVLTGRYPFGHGLVSEWGTVPAAIPNLAIELARAGYHTAFAPSQQVYGRPELGFARLFAEVLPCRTNPNQQGDVTTRQVKEWIESRADDRPWFLWVTYFDTHPPYRLPDELVRQFYDGDPRDPSQAHRTEDVRSLRSSETLLAFDATLPALRAGNVDGGLLARLRDTARTLEGRLESGPDLAMQLEALGPAARRGLGIEEFTQWLRGRVSALESGVVEPDLLRWLTDDLIPRLREVEQQALAWARGVVDFRYAVALAQAGAAHVDGQVAELVACLQSSDQYDDCTMVFCSPHVELFGAQSQFTHHASLGEAIVQVPLVFKPGRSLGTTTPATVNGPIELVDLMPTILDGLGLPLPQTDGVSRWAALSSGAPVPEHDTFVVGYEGSKIAITAGGHKVVKTLAGHNDGVRWSPPGSVLAFDLTADGEVPAADRPHTQALTARLERWLGVHRP